MEEKTEAEKATKSKIDDETRELLLGEYKSCSQVMSDASSLIWGRFNVFIVITAGLVPAWAVIWYNTLSLPFFWNLLPLPITLVGIIVSLVWVFIMYRAQAIQDFWMARLRVIEKQFQWKMETFDTLRELKYWVGRPYHERRRARYLQLYPPVIFLGLWSFLTLITSLLIFFVSWLFIGLILIGSYLADKDRKTEESKRIEEIEKERTGQPEEKSVM